MQAAIIIFPGSNREPDVCLAWKLATGKEPLRVWHGETSLPDADLIILPGGFAHGDYLRCGAMAARAPIMREVKSRAERGTPVLGLLPDPEDATDPLMGGTDGRGLFDGLVSALQ